MDYLGGYGEFNVFGTEQQAEEMRRHKANWEGAIAKKRRGRLCTLGEALYIGGS